MNAILHCGRCGSWAEFLTDGDGNVAERLNHECQCPPMVVDPPTRGRRPQPAGAKKSHHKPKPGLKRVMVPHPCRGCPRIVPALGKWCAECQKVRNRIDCRMRARRRRGERSEKFGELRSPGTMKEHEDEQA